MDELVARIEAAGMARHGDEPGSLLRRHDPLGVPNAVGEGDLDLDVSPASKALGSPGRRASGSASPKITASRPGSFSVSASSVVAWATPYFLCRLLGLVELAPDQRDHLDPVDLLDAVEMLEAEGAGPRQRNLDGLGQ